MTKTYYVAATYGDFDINPCILQGFDNYDNALAYADIVAKENGRKYLVLKVADTAEPKQEIAK